MARYQMLSARASQANAAANPNYQRAIAQAIQSARRQQRPAPRRYDQRERVPRSPAPAVDSTAAGLLAPEQVLTAEGTVRWPASAPSDRAFAKTRAAAESAIRIAVKEYAADGRASTQCVDEARSLLVAYGEPAIKRAALINRSEADRLLTFFTTLEDALSRLAGR
jgi:hypothetical protein